MPDDAQLSTLTEAAAAADTDLVYLATPGMTKKFQISKVYYDKGRSCVNAAHPDFGGLSVSGTADNAAALNAAAAFCRAGRHKLVIPAGRFRLLSTLTVTDTTFQSIEIEGQGRGFGPGAGNVSGRTVLFFDFNDKPGALVNFGRGVIFRDLAFESGNTAPTLLTEPTDVQSQYISSGYRISRYSPHCAVAIDGTTGTTPPDGGYSGMTYAGIGTSGSWDVTFDRCAFYGFVVGVVGAPGGTTAQGDSVKFRNCRFESLDVAYAPCQSQARVVSFDGCDFFFCRYAFNGVIYGAQSGCPPVSVTACQFGHVFALHVLPNTIGPMCYIGCRTETVQMIGAWGFGSASLRHPLSFVGCDFRISDDVFTAYKAPFILEHWSPIHFAGCTFASDFTDRHGTFNFAGHGGDSTFHGCSFHDASTTNMPLVGMQPDVTSHNSYSFNSCLAVNSSGSFLIGNLNRHLTLAARVDAQYATQWVADGTQEYVYRHGHYSNYVFAGAGSSFVWSSTTLSFTVADPLLFQVGDIMFWEMLPVNGGQNAVVPSLRVTSIVSTTVTCSLIFPRARYYEASNQGLILVRREWAPGQQAITGDLASGTPTVSNVSPVNVIKNGDWILASSGLPANTRVVSGGGDGDPYAVAQRDDFRDGRVVQRQIARASDDGGVHDDDEYDDNDNHDNDNDNDTMRGVCPI